MERMSNIPARRFGSLAAAMVTPMTDTGEIDLTSAQRLAIKLVDEGCDTILLSGTTGESPTTHQPEKNDLTEAVREAVGDRAFILCGACSNDTAHAVRIGDGADGIMIVSPYYNRPSQEGLRAHVRAVTDATDLPVMLYDIPGRTGIAFSDATLDILAQHPRILGVKDATGDVETGVERMHRTGLEYYSGDDGLNFAWMTGGASGFISVVTHVASAQYRRMIELLDSDQVWEARELSYSLRPLVHAIMGGGQGAVMAKYALWLQGVIDSPAVRLALANHFSGSLHHAVRLPMVGISDDEVSALRRALCTAGLL